jgi:N-hydroxyarylamine O-acetyltransferase
VTRSSGTKVDLDAYFERIGWTGPVTATHEVLTGLCLRHTASVPFENLDILLGRGISLDQESVFDKIVTRRRGGYCFEQNALFKTVLRQLGFRVTGMAARVRLGVAPDVETPRTHMLLRVDLDNGPYIADVGFGFTPTGPLRLESGVEQALHLDTYRLVRTGSVWTLEIHQDGGFVPAYVFTEEPALAVDYEMGNHYTSTHPRSFFTLGPLVMRHAPDQGFRHVLRGKEWTTRRRGAIETRTIGSADEALRVLAEHFLLPFPAGTRFPGLP